MKDDVDSILDGEDFFLIHSTETEDQVYAKKAMNMTIVVRVEDDDDAGIIFDNDNILEVKEGDSLGATFMIRGLTTNPLADVQLILTSSLPSLLNIEPTVIQVAAMNAMDFNVSVTVTAQVGDYREGASALLSIRAESKDLKYNKMTTLATRNIAIETKKYLQSEDCGDEFYLNDTDPNPKQFTCLSCPSGASCRGPVILQDIVPMFGWSRCPEDRYLFEKCDFPAGKIF